MGLYRIAGAHLLGDCDAQAVVNDATYTCIKLVEIAAKSRLIGTRNIYHSLPVSLQ